MTREQAVLALAERYPSPWVIGWNYGDGRCHLEATQRIAPKRHARVFGAGPTWREALDAVR